MKKILLLVLALLMMLPIVSCDKTPDDTDPPIDPKEVFDFILEKDPSKDFVVLNITDPQLHYMYWGLADNVHTRTMKDTVTELVTKVKPDLITISGDYTQNAEARVFREMGLFFDSFGIPWAPVWGNHDYDAYRSEDDKRGAKMEIINKIFTTAFENCLYIPGPAELGNGNYTIGISENGKIVQGFFMMDTHSSDIGFEGFNEAQIEWYRTKVGEMKDAGCKESMVIQHINLPIFGVAVYNAVPDLKYHQSLTVEQTHQGLGWAEEYKDTSFGISTYSCPSATDAFFDAVKELGHTKNILAGHDHGSNFSIIYEGVRLTHAVKTGMSITDAWVFDKGLNGGTVITVTSNGIGLSGIKHEYIPVQDYFTREDLDYGYVFNP